MSRGVVNKTFYENIKDEALNAIGMIENHYSISILISAFQSNLLILETENSKLLSPVFPTVNRKCLASLII